MQTPLEITEHGLELSEAARRRIEGKARWLERYYDRITGCRVVIEAPRRRLNRGSMYDLRVEVTVPGRELIVKRQAGPNLSVAIRDAFSAARRQLEDYARRRRGQVKTHPRASAEAAEEA